MILDQIFNKKIGFGQAQIISLAILSLVDLNDGAQLILSKPFYSIGSFLTPIIQQEWNLTDNQASILASVFYLGIFFGSIISGHLSDKYGRRPLTIIGSVLQIIMALQFIFINTYSAMVLARLMYGFSFGFSICLTTSIFAEISPV